MSKYDLRFDLIETPRDIRELGDFLLKNNGDYDVRKHTQWVHDICLPAIKTDKRRALAWWQHGQMVGDAVLKPLQTGMAELKNFRIAPSAAHRGLGNMMLKHAVLEAADLLTDKGFTVPDGNLILQLDTIAGSQAERFFAANGFDVTGTLDDYPAQAAGVIMQRQISLH